jgi:hypothetical protein
VSEESIRFFVYLGKNGGNNMKHIFWKLVLVIFLISPTMNVLGQQVKPAPYFPRIIVDASGTLIDDAHPLPIKAPGSLGSVTVVLAETNEILASQTLIMATDALHLSEIATRTRDLWNQLKQSVTVRTNATEPLHVTVTSGGGHERVALINETATSPLQVTVTSGGGFDRVALINETATSPLSVTGGGYERIALINETATSALNVIVTSGGGYERTALINETATSPLNVVVNSGGGQERVALINETATSPLSVTVTSGGGYERVALINETATSALQVTGPGDILASGGFDHLYVYDPSVIQRLIVNQASMSADIALLLAKMNSGVTLATGSSVYTTQVNAVEWIGTPSMRLIADGYSHGVVASNPVFVQESGKHLVSQHYGALAAGTASAVTALSGRTQVTVSNAATETIWVGIGQAGVVSQGFPIKSELSQTFVIPASISVSIIASSPSAASVLQTR